LNNSCEILIHNQREDDVNTAEALFPPHMPSRQIVEVPSPRAELFLPPPPAIAMSAAAAPMSSAGRPKKRKRPFPAPLAPLPSDEKEAQNQNRQQEGEHETGKEGSGILTSRLFSELPISDLIARAIAEMGHTRLTHVRPLHPIEIPH
jgi:hypothetical protein